MRVRFTRDYDWRVHPRQVVAFRKDWEGPVTRACAKAAIAAGAAEDVTPKRSKTDDES